MHGHAAPSHGCDRSGARWARFCPWVVAVILLTMLPRWAYAQTGSDLLVKPFLDDNSYEDFTSGEFYPAGHEQEEPSHFQLNEVDSQGRARFGIPGVASGQKFLFVGYDVTYLDLSTHGPLLPDRLLDSSIGLGLGLAKFNNNILAVSGGIGYAGNNPYAQSNAIYGKGDLLLAHQFDKDTNLVFVLDYDGNRGLLPDTPLPGVAYQGKYGDGLEYVVGFPFSSLVWHPYPAEPLTVTFNYEIPDSLSGSVGFQPNAHWNFFGGYDQAVTGFHQDDQPQTRRLFFEQQRFEVGARWLPRPSVEVVGALGYALDQRFERGFDIQRVTGVTRVSDEPYLRVGVNLRF